MGLSKEEKQKRAAEAAALLNKNLEDAQAAFDALTEDATDEQKEEAQKNLDDAKTALLVVKPSGKKVKVKFLLSPTRKYALAYSIGEEGEFEVKQATELVEAKYAEFVK